MEKRQCCFLLCTCLFIAGAVSETTSSTLQLVQVLYRHGDRNILKPYPKDPYGNISYWPEGFGELTNVGKMQQYHLGLYLRQRYKYFLPKHYSPNTIYVRSTDVGRTLMSAMCNLAGLFPPDNSQLWNPSLAWQPIPVHTVSEHEDYLLRMKRNCSRYEAELERVKHSPVIQQINKENKALYEYLEQYTGDKINNPEDVNRIYDTLHIETLKGYMLPNWTQSVFPDKLLPLSDISFTIPALTKELQRLRSGPLIKEMLHHMNHKRKGTLQPDRQMFMYSAHDSTIAPFLMALGVFNPPHFPPYAAAVIVELHKNSEEEYQVMVLYRNNTSVGPYVMTIPGCTEMCPLDVFEGLLIPVIPGDMDEECQLFYSVVPSS